MCVICVDMSGQFRRSSFLPDDIGVDLAVGPGQRAPDQGPLSYLDLDDRGGTSPNGKVSLLPGDAGNQLTRTNARWSTNIGDPVTVTYAFRATAPGTMPNQTTGFSQFTATQIAATELMLTAWSDVARITFNRVGSGTTGPGAYSDAATMLFGNYASGAENAAAFAYLAGNADHSASSGDVWVNSSLSYNASPQYLAYGYQVLLHEIGHGIGLSHPGDYNAGNGSPSYNDAVYYEDTRQYSVMSYWPESNTGGNNGGNYASAPLLDDIAAAQRLYGANMTTRTGDTVYGFNSTADRIWYNAGTPVAPQAVVFAVWDAGGTDTLDFSGYNQVSTIDLRQGHFSNVGGLVGNVSIAMGAVIENAIGGAGVDAIHGNSANNRLTGGLGDDNIWGGNGSDTAVFSGNRAAYTITYGTELIAGVVPSQITTVSGPDGTDVLRGVEFLQFADQTVTVAHTSSAGILLEGDATSETLNGTTYADYLYGADGDDTINGGDGSDVINGGRGADTLNGGNGVDTLDYSNSTGGVTVNMGTGTSSGAAGSDTFNGFEQLRGSNYNDTLTGSEAGESIYGWGGVDTINGGGGDDLLVAGAGTLVGAADVIKPSNSANIAIGSAVNIDANFDKMNDPGIADATTVPHAVIRGTGAGAGQEYYAFTVTAGVTAIFDIAGASFDTTLRIFDASGSQLTWNDDDGSGTNSYISYTFATAGTYYVAVGAWQSGTGTSSTSSGPPPLNGSYVLNVSVPGHTFVPITDVGSTLNGGEGNDALQSGSSADVLNGGNGNDTAILAGPRSNWTFTSLGGGSYSASNGTQTDTLTSIEHVQFTDGTYTMASLTNTPTSGADELTGTAGDDNINGLAGNDTIMGLGGNDWLDGGADVDTLYGSTGNDVYVVDNIGDQTHELSNEGYDTVLAHTNWTLSADIEQLYLLGAATHGIGNAGNNYLIGNELNNFLYGGDGGDRLDGGAGNDWLQGNGQFAGDNGGLDLLIGGTGDDTYVVEAGDTAQESAGEGYDVVLAYADWTLGANFEQLNLYGSAYYGAGNSGNNLLIGNNIANNLQGMDGNDTIRGSGGADSLWGGTGADVFVYQSASDSNLAATDFIQDFQTGVDKIDLRALRTGSSDTFQIVAHNLGTGTWILIDLGGNGSEDARIFLNGTLGVQASDILWDGPPAALAGAEIEPGGKILTFDQPLVLPQSEDLFDPLVLPQLNDGTDASIGKLDDAIVCRNPGLIEVEADLEFSGSAQGAAWVPDGMRPGPTGVMDWDWIA